jgi:hypothetical protein
MSERLSENQVKKQYREACENYRFEYVSYMAKMVGCGQAMPLREKRALQKWEEVNLDGCTVGTTDWPGWEKYIGPKPIPPERPSQLAVFKKKSIPTSLRVRVFVRDGGKCVKCGSVENLHADHILPESQDGATTLMNLQTLCASCNSKKGAKNDG